MHISPMFSHQCVQFCKEQSSLVCAIKTNEQQLTEQRLMAIPFTAQAVQWQCRNAGTHSSITSSLLPGKGDVQGDALSASGWVLSGAPQPELCLRADALGDPSLLTKYTRNPAPTFKTQFGAQY